jgi:hypothetical protein
MAEAVERTHDIVLYLPEQQERLADRGVQHRQVTAGQQGAFYKPAPLDDQLVQRGIAAIHTALSAVQAKGYRAEELPRAFGIANHAGWTGMHEGAIYNYVAQIVLLNPYGFILQGDSRREPLTRESVEASTPSEAIIHEIGHHINNPMNNGDVRQAWGTMSDVDSVKVQVNLMFAHIQGWISGYATTNADEFMAEMFLKLIRGDAIAPLLVQLYQLHGGRLPAGAHA